MLDLSGNELRPRCNVGTPVKDIALLIGYGNGGINQCHKPAISQGIQGLLFMAILMGMML